jgi:hypothetical protein
MLRSEPPFADAAGDLAMLAIEVFQPHYDEPLSLDQGHGMTRSVTDVLSLLSEWRADTRAVEEVQAPEQEVAAPPEMVSGKRPRRPRGRKFPPEMP